MKLPSMSHLTDRYRHLVTIQNAGLAIALIVALSWMWGAVMTLQKNYQHQRDVDINSQKIELAKLQNQNYKYQQAYFKSDEFLESSAREKLGLAQPGEHLVILPSSEGITDTVTTTLPATPGATVDESNWSKWMNFFFGSRPSSP